MELDLERNLSSVTEQAALAVASLIGIQDKIAVDQAAVDAMRETFSKLNIGAKVVVGEGEKDQAPSFIKDEQVGRKSNHEIDLAIDPIEGTEFAAKNRPNAVAVLAGVEKGKMLQVPDIYMDKIVVGPRAKGKVSLQQSPAENLANLAQAKDKEINDLTVAVLDRPRHQELIYQLKAVGANVRLITGADLIWAIAAVKGMFGLDMLIGSGGAPEGILTAAAVKCLGGDMEIRLCPRNQTEKDKIVKMGIKDCQQIFKLKDIIQGEKVIVSLTGVTDGILVDGIRNNTTQSIVMNRNSAGQSYLRKIKTDYSVAEKLKIS